MRITSRTAEWPVSLEQALKTVFGDDGVGVYELAPLTREQVSTALRAEGIDEARFIQEVLDREVASFAIKPLTLSLLVRIWKARGGSLPPSQLEIYDQGCLELCSESNPDRYTPRLRRVLTPQQRLDVASHIAASNSTLSPINNPEGPTACGSGGDRSHDKRSASEISKAGRAPR